MGCINAKGFEPFEDDVSEAAVSGNSFASRGRRNSAEVRGNVKRRFSLEGRSLPPAPSDAVRYPYEMTPQEKIDMQALFSLFDTDGSAKITHVELREGLLKMSFDCSEADAKAMVDQLDLARGSKSGSDGELDFKEFVRGVLNKDSLLRSRLYPVHEVGV